MATTDSTKSELAAKERRVEINMNMFTWFDETVIGSVKDGWFANDELDGTMRSKRLRAFSQLLKGWCKFESASGYEEDAVDFNSLPKMVIFAPQIQHAGFVTKRQFPSDSILVYLSPTLEFNSQRDVTHTVAHEIAHVVLGHYGVNLKYDANLPYEKQPQEIAANALAAKWGFPTRKRGKTGFVRMIEAAQVAYDAAVKS